MRQRQLQLSRNLKFSSVLAVWKLHCNENTISVFPEKELRGLSPNFYIHVSVSDIHIPRIGPSYFPAAE
jgi:hypothetical protein